MVGASPLVRGSLLQIAAACRATSNTQKEKEKGGGGKAGGGQAVTRQERRSRIARAHMRWQRPYE
jgi:ribosomal protein L4